MFYEQYITRWVFAIPTLVLMLLFLPIKGGGYQFMGINDWEFISSGTLDFPRLLLQIIGVVVITFVVEKLVLPKTSYP